MPQTVVWDTYFDINFYRYSMKLLVFLPEEVYMESLLLRKGVTQGGYLYMVPFGLSPLVIIEKMWVEYPGFLQ